MTFVIGQVFDVFRDSPLIPNPPTWLCRTSTRRACHCFVWIQQRQIILVGYGPGR
ncbi:uncharacterized protein LACBIDRAFT_310663 [Laccaria bicolor S238N-H82]|uniref:Predicted protein n=1 Tax=Laccaria bicolor (strain S238N-H82 / ATCC MYA-4686) TaxID=486041 RepID=B0DIZ9_LACBS|nr:uncharacterized protein LACBIDRAFT_303131 [Laccaria bicolor S238N-H82]XP_001887747.1 uncharacterized protein LACBIDRAFT_310663 [Laccaria bicolor S238N-H82]EDR01671.1 predicted protein [Laccaria bicolor S238N-H82]EDR05320.1 predicted protein [Laccaria bicolor S238N-H82]|eukprot:XP_001883878.1 predicted protein [Laccaria bicolor S238N-H82]